MIRLWTVPVMIVAVCPIGCLITDRFSKPVAKPIGPQRVDWSGFALGEPGKGTISREAFGERVAVLLRANRQLSGRLYIQRYPDVALTFLRLPPTGTTPDVLAFVERVYEGQCTAGRRSAWEERRNVAVRLSEPSLDADGVLKLCKASQPTEAALDATLLGAQIELKANRPRDAVDMLKAGAPFAEGRPYEAVDLHLLYAEGLRRAGQAAPAAAEWIKATVLAMGLLIRPPGVTDPRLWERLASNRPIDTPWPPEIKATLMNAAAIAGLPLPEAVSDEGALWAAVGCWRMDRNELDAALKAFKRAETMTADLVTRNLLQVWQAKALTLADQANTAMALLVPLVDHPSPLVAGPASATLAAIKLQGGAARQSRALLEQTEKLPGAWAGKIDAEADLALALILDGDEQQGIARLKAAQRRFSMAGDLPGLLRCLRNEAEYWATKDDTARAREIKKRMQAIEETGTDPDPVMKP